MAFISAYSFAKTANRSRYGNVANGLLFSVDKAGGGKNSDRFSLRFRIGVDIVDEARFIPGDRVDVLFDSNDKTGLIKRVSTGGWSLSISGESTEDSKKNKKTKPLNVKFSMRPGMPWIKSGALCESVTVTNEGILFKFPDDVVFGYGVI